MPNSHSAKADYISQMVPELFLVIFIAFKTYYHCSNINLGWPPLPLSAADEIESDTFPSVSQALEA